MEDQYIEPNRADGEDCPACAVLEDLCDYHQGCADGWDAALSRVASQVEKLQAL